MKRTILAGFAMFCGIALTGTTAAQTVTDIPFDTLNWVLPENYQLTEFEGKQTLLIEKTATYEFYHRDSYAYLKDYDFSDGIIEFDFYSSQGDIAYVGFIFRFNRHKEEDRYELFYFRPFMSKSLGAVQYFPVNNKTATFAYYSDNVYQSTATVPYNAWNHVKAEIKGPRAVVSINDTEVMTVNNLGRGLSKGSIGVWMENTTPKCYFADLKVTR